MITKTTGLDSSYSSLFAEIKEKSEGSIDVNNLEEFFMNVREIAELDEKFLMLPLDEPMFEINADSRKITVPDEFKSNGLSVQGDHLAETVFFKIDRYFDFVDLDNMDILINWKMGDVTKASRNFIKNTDIAPGYIIFGWSIGKELTAKSGSLTFAVQFYKKDLEGNYDYNFNTQTATINIKDGLVLVDPEVVNNSEDILAMLVNSVYGEGDAAVETAEWISQLALEGQEFSPIINLEVSVEDGIPSVIPALLIGEAVAEGATIDYSSSNDFIVEDGKVKITVNGVGDYRAIAQGAKYDAEDKKIGSGEAAESLIVTVPAAKQPIVELSINDESANIKDNANYELLADNVAFLKPVAGVVLNAVVSPADDMTEDDMGAFEVIWKKGDEAIDEVEDLAYIAYEVEENDHVSRQFKARLTSEDDPIEGVEDSYKVEVIHFKNGDFAEPVSSNEISLQFAPDAIGGVSVTTMVSGVERDALASGVEFNSLGSLSKKSVTVTASIAELAEDALSDNITFEWLKASSSDAEDWAVVGNEASLTITSEAYYKVVVRNIYKNCAYVVKSTAFLANDLKQA